MLLKYTDKLLRVPWLILGALWLVIFAFAGLYEIPWDVSRIDYIFLILRTVIIGTIILFFATFDFESASIEGRITTLVYGAAVNTRGGG